MICSWFIKTLLVSLLGFSTLYLSWNGSDLFFCQFLWGPLHYDASCGMPDEASDSTASVPRITRNIVTHLGLLSTLCDLLLSVYARIVYLVLQSFYFVQSPTKNEILVTIIITYFGKIS